MNVIPFAAGSWPYISVASFALISAMSSFCSGQIVFDATADFSTLQNPNGAWSYHFSDDVVRDGSYDLFTEVDPLGGGTGGGSLVWHADSGAATAQRPFIGINTTGAPGSQWEAGELGIHPGQSNNGGGPGLAVLSQTSPTSGSVDVDFSFQLGLPGATNWFFEQNNSGTTLELGALGGTGSAASFSISQLSVQQGDTLNLVFNSGASPGNVLVRINSGTISFTAVPEPSSIILMSVLAFSCIALRFRISFKRQKTTIAETAC